MKVRITKIQQLRNGVRRYGILGASRRIYWKIYRRAVGNRMPYRAAISEIWLQTSGPIIIRGWSLGPNPIDSVSIILDGRVKVETKQRLIREDVRNNYPKYDDLYSGFTGTVSKGIQSLIGNS